MPLTIIASAPLLYELGGPESVQLTFLNGPIESPPITGVAEQYDGPYFRFFDDDIPSTFLADMERLSSKGNYDVSPEDAVRQSFRERGYTTASSSQGCDFLEQYIEKSALAPFDGVLGFSEGAAIAATLLLRRSARKQRPLFRFAIFICGLVPLRHDINDVALADEAVERVEIPTAHIIGSKDSVKKASLALFNFCKPSQASLYDHSSGHAIPWGGSTSAMAEEIRSVMRRSIVDEGG
ncbi:MAG: hypothetical protein Q9190_003537 [Brigantiaea leucoxantha]